MVAKAKYLTPLRVVLAGVLALGPSVGFCHTVGPNFTPPPLPAPATYAMAGDATPGQVRLIAETRVAGLWWRDLGSPMLDQVMDEALANNQTVAAADAALQVRRAEQDRALGETRPRVDAGANLQRERINTASFGFSGFPSPTINLYRIGATVAYQLDVFGGGRRRVEAAKARSEAQARRADAAYLTLTGNVALQAVRIAGLRSQAQAVGAIIEDDRQLVEMVHRAQAVGGQPASASSGAIAQLAADVALAPALGRQLSEARHALAVLVGRSPAEWTAPDFEEAGFAQPAVIPTVLPSTLVRRRPDIQAAEAALHADTAEIGVATADLYPRLNLSAALTQEALQPGRLFNFAATAYSVGGGLTAPVLNGGALRARRRAAEAQARVSLANYRQTVLEAFVQVSDVMSNLANDDRRLDTLKRARAASNDAMTDARTALRLGGGDLAQALLAERLLNHAALNLAEASGQRLSDLVMLYAATAGNWRATASGSPPPAP